MFAAKGVLVLCLALTASAFDMGDTDMVFHLYTARNPTVSEPMLPSFNAILSSGMNPGVPTVMTIHSWGEGVGGNFNAFLVNAHLAAQDVNVIAVDWSPGSTMYSHGLANAAQCGKVISDFINILVEQLQYDANNIRIVGVGLGGHIAGIAARQAARPIPHIVALDPSLVGWTHNPLILNPNDAGVVEVLHTTAGGLGYDYPLGDIDFYPNGGSFQSGCGTDLSCSHIYAYAFYAESITQEVSGGSRFVGTKCESYEEATQLQCAGERDAVFGGTELKTEEAGIYTFLTNMVPPFARD